MSGYPIPDDALDDRLACVGTSGSGKTYAMGTAVEKLLARGSRVVIPDPLGVWWGLRLRESGATASRFNVVIFGGPHGDLPLTEHAGALIGEAAATMAESCIIDLSELGTKAAERRFMLGFLTALYRRTAGEPLHLVLDEADMWAPQMVREKEGDAVKLLGMMETIVRRGRIKGFIPWLITQRPAVLNKDVLSQVDGVIAMKLVATQDRDALDGWIEGSADRAEAKRIKGDMPGLQLGQGIVWLPGRGVLHTAQFPRKVTFDSSRTPKRGEIRQTHTLKPLDVAALKEKLATVEAEVASTDPKKLKARVAELERQLKTAPASPEVLEKARGEGRKEGYADGYGAGMDDGLSQTVPPTVDLLKRAIEALEKKAPAKLATAPRAPTAPSVRQPPPPRAARPASAPSGELTGPESRILGSLAFWEQLGFSTPTNEQVSAVAGYSPNSSAYKSPRAALKTNGLIDYMPGGLTLTDAGRDAAPAAPKGSPRDLLEPHLSGPEKRILDSLPQDGTPVSNDSLAAAAGYSPDSSAYKSPRSALRTLGLVTYPSAGLVAAETWVFETA